MSSREYTEDEKTLWVKAFDAARNTLQELADWHSDNPESPPFIIAEGDDHQFAVYPHSPDANNNYESTTVNDDTVETDSKEPQVSVTGPEAVIHAASSHCQHSLTSLNSYARQLTGETEIAILTAFVHDLANSCAENHLNQPKWASGGYKDFIKEDLGEMMKVYMGVKCNSMGLSNDHVESDNDDDDDGDRPEDIPQLIVQAWRLHPSEQDESHLVDN
ncbi:hypothetical protein M231_04922 [Tremella mesenterica]|uniref:Uncharacterized protein n=1 Tax=Tremella mesenterica TaxID=5217 RepID=A0A4Q1BJF3_TREME|nr:hypothetical protein M231_04922 [Tremella mesenterica]